MLDLTNNAQTFIPLAVLVASLAGSGHCVAMCGGLVASMAPSPRALVAYHLGRFFGYVVLGALAGFLGKAVLASSLKSVSLVSIALLAATFVFLGARLLLKGQVHLALPGPIARAHQRLLALAAARRETLVGVTTFGALTALLPCGWLYTFVLAAVATQSVARGALVLFVFWLGTLPALVASPLLFRRVLGPLVRRAPKLSGIILILVGMTSLSIRAYPLFRPADAPKHHCHMHVAE